MTRLFLVVPLVAALGCAHTQSKTDSIAQRAAAGSQSAAAAGAADAACSTDGDCGSRQLCIRSRCVDITANVAECNATRVRFAFNSALVEESDRPLIERSARCLRADHALHVTIEGNADERGTEEYNMALGDQRAEAVAKFLAAQGATKEQLRTVSYGKERPLCVQHDEACWSQNRRAALKLADVRSSDAH